MSTGDPSSIPLAARVPGWLDVVPFAWLAAATAYPEFIPPAFGIAPAPSLAAYGCADVSFMGGVLWGPTMRVEDQTSGCYTASVLPALLGWFALLAPIRPGLDLLAIGFVGLLAYDLWTVRRGIAPPWYRSLRWPFAIGVVLFLGMPSAIAGA